MGATASSAQQDSRCEEDAAAEEQTEGASDARDDASADDKLLQTNGQISSLNIKTKNHADELNGHFEERVLADVGSGFVTIKEDGTETIEDLHDVDTLQPNTQNESREMVNSDGVTVKEGMEEDGQVNDINEVGFKKIFRFVGFRFSLKKDTCEKTEGEGLLANEQVEKVASTSEYFEATKETITEAANENCSYENTPDDPLNSAVSAQPEPADPSQKTENETKVDQDADIVEHNVEVTPYKEQVKVVEASPEPEEPEPEEPMSPIKQFFTEGIFASLRKKKKEVEIQKERKEEELKIIYKRDAAEAEKEGSKCICLDIPHIMSEEEKDSQGKGDIKFLPEEELQVNSLEKDKVQGSPLKRLFRKFSTRRQRENKAAVNVIEAEEKVSEQPESSSELTEIQKVEEPLVEEPKSAEEEQLADVSPQESKKKSDSTVSWEALICGGSARKRARKTNEDETPDKGEEYEKKTESPLGSSFEGDYDHLTSSSEQAGSPGEGEAGSTWKTFKKMVTPKRKVRTGGSSSPEQISSDSEMNKDDSFSIKKLIPGHKKRKSDAMREQTSSDEAGKDAESGDEDDETPAIIPLSEYEIIEPESLREVNEKLVEITIEHEMTEMTSQVLDKDKPNESEPKFAAKVSNNVLSENFEELTDFMSKHQQLNDMPEEGIIEESIETPISSAVCTTQDDSFAEDFVVPASEEFIGEDTTEMVSAVSQLTESPKTSGHVTPVLAEYSIQKSDVILQEAVQSMCMTPSVQSVTTKDERQKFLTVSLSPYILQSSTPEETKVLVAHKKTDATAICTGLISQEIESLEEPVPAPLMEEVPEVSDAVLTELVSDNLTDEPEVAGLGTDEVYEAEIMEVKTKYKKQITINATETELNIEQVIQLMAEQDKEECPTEPVMGIEPVYVAVIDTIQREAVLDQVIAANTHDPMTEGPLHPVLEESVYIQPVHYTEVTAEVEKVIKLPDVELSAAEFEQAALPEVLEFLTHYVASVPDTTRSEIADIDKEGIDIFASTVECLETKDTISFISPISDPIKVEVIEVEDRIQTELAESVHDDVHEIQLDIKDTVLKTAGAQVETVLQVVSAGDSAIVVEDTCEQIQEGKMEHQEIEDIHVEESMDVVASEDFQNFEAENISGTAAEFFVREELEEKQLNIPAEEVSLPETVLVEETEEVDKVTPEPEELPKEIDTYVEDKVEEDACYKTDRKGLNEEEEIAVKEGQPLTNTEADESENLEVAAHTHITEASPEIIEQDVRTENAEMVNGIREDLDVSEISKDVLEHKETTAEPEADSGVMLTHLETAVPLVETRSVQTEIMDFQTELSLDSEQSPETSKEDKQTITTENIKTVQVLEMVVIMENVTKQSEMEKLVPVAQALVISELPEVTEKDNDALAITDLIAETRGGDQVDHAPVMVATEITETSAPEEKDKTPVVTEPESSGPTEIKVAGTTESESVGVAQNYTATQNEVNSVSKHKDEATEDTMLKCEPAEQIVEKPLAINLQIENAEIKDEIPAVMDMKEESSAVTKLEVAPMSQTLPLSSEIEAETLEVTELKAATLEMTEPMVETHVATEVEVETALEVETPFVTSVVAELEVDSPVVTSMTKTIDTHSSAAISVNQNKDSDTALLTEEVKEQVVGMPTVTPVVLTPAEALDVVTTVVALGNGSRPVASVKEIQDVTLLVGTPAVDPVAVSTVEMQNVTPVAKTLALSSGIITETTPPEVVILTVTAVSKTSVVSPVVETPVVTPVVDTTTVAPAVEIPNGTPELNISMVGKVTVALTATPMVETSVVSVTNIETPIVAIPAVTPVTETSVVSPVFETTVASTTSEITSKPIAIAEAETLVVTPVNETPDVVSVTVTEAIAPVIFTSPLTSIAETSVMTTVVETPAVKPVAVTEIPAVTPVVVAPLVTPLAETSVVSPVVEPQALKPVAVTEIPDVTSVGMTPALASVIVTEAASTVVTLAVTAKAETSAVSPLVETPLVMPTAVAVAETPVVTPVVVTPAVTPVAETSVVIPVVKTPAVKPVTMTETSVVTPVDETIAVKPVAMGETPVFTPVLVTPAVTPIAQTSLVMPVVESPTAKSVVVAETQAVTPVVEIPAVKPAAMTETPLVTQVVETAAIKQIAVTKSPLVTPVVESPAVKPVAVTEASTVTAVVVKPVVTPVAETSGVSPVEETLQLAESVAAVGETTVLTPVVVTPAVTAVAEKSLVMPVVESPPVKSVAVAETPVETPVIEILAVKPVEMTETPVVTPLAETPVVTPGVKTPAVKPVAVAETPDVTSVVVTPALVSVIVTEAASPVLTLPVIAKAETSVVSPVAETPLVMPTAVAVAETPVVTPVVVTPAVSPVDETSVVTPVLETPAVKPVAMAKTPVLTPVEVTSAVTPVAETPFVTPVVETPAIKPVAGTETPIVTPVVATPVLLSVIVTEAASSVFTPAVMAIAETSIVSPVVETPAVKLITVAETPVVIPVLQTSALVTVIETVATSPVVSPAVSPLANKSVESPVVETPAVKPVAVADTSVGIQMVVTPTVIQTAETSVVSPVVEIRAVKPPAATVDETPVVSPVVKTLVDQMASTPVTSIVPSVLRTPVINEVVETPTVTSTVEKPAKAPVLVTPYVAPVVVTPVVKEKKAELLVVDENDVKPQLVTEKEVKTSILTVKGISNVENAKGSLKHEPIATSTELQSEVEEDVWEDAVDNIGVAVQTQADGVPQDTAAKEASDAPI
ncbi:A-kinase anchor protein 12 [Myxocyprinus asiaticus]|uniref:A-kinase anchor protein 12 n=1 Tax=Myxocyprinus asiaticus TaxID=70543 RepID=UPI002223C315|nr:A-kinase anchor protein 12 [Myxocyprinus asiaticus]